MPLGSAGYFAVLSDEGMERVKECAPTHVRGVREHFIDRLSERQLANLTAALSVIEIDDAQAAGGCDAAP